MVYFKYTQPMGVETMLDYRDNPEGSPFAWCPKLQRLIAVNDSVIVMKTVFHVHSSGIYPYVRLLGEKKQTAS